MKKILITIPCYNEELVLEKTVFSIYEYAVKYLSQFSWTILILDNNSNDSTWDIAQKIKTKYPNQVLTQKVTLPGRGIALKTAWLSIPNYDIYAYMDADLATDIKDFSFLIEKIDEGYDLVTGSRYLSYSDVQRNIKREFLSRVYNMLLKIVLKVDFNDAQCGFKAFSQKLVEEVFPDSEDHGWFWDTELMILASIRGYKVLEIPVSWRETRDELRRSKVSVLSEVFKNLKNIYIMRQRLLKKNGKETLRNV